MNVSETLTWLKNHWFLFVALFIIGIAWGTMVSQIATTEATVERLKSVQDNSQYEIGEIKNRTERLDERTQLMQHSLQRQEAILIQLLQSQRRLESATTMRND